MSQELNWELSNMQVTPPISILAPPLSDFQFYSYIPKPYQFIVYSCDI